MSESLRNFVAQNFHNTMEQEKIEQFLTTNGKFFAEKDYDEICDLLSAVDDEKMASLTTLQFKDPSMTLILSLILTIGLDRFYLDQTLPGVGKLLTCGGCWAWWLYDVICAKRNAYNRNIELLKGAL